MGVRGRKLSASASNAMQPGETFRMSAACAALLFAAACDSSNEAGSMSPAGDGSTAPLMDAGGCPMPGVPLPAEAVCVETISGRYIDETGQPIESDVLVSACGPAQCNPGFTDAEGRFVIPVGLYLTVADYSVLAHGRPHYSPFYFRVPTDDPDRNIEMGDLRRISMPADGPLITVDRMGAPAQSLTSGEVTLEVPDGVFVRLDVESLAAVDEGRMFRALRVPDALLGEFVDPALSVLALYGFEPFESRFELPGTPPQEVDIRLSFENTLGLAAGERVQVLALGSYVIPDWLPPAVFEPVAAGQVTSDGSRIELDPGTGVKYLTWVALRAEP